MIVVHSHRRSGTHFLMRLLKLNFAISRKFSHRLPHKNLNKSFVHIYIIRDCRDVLVANYHYWYKGGESLNTDKVFKSNEITFSDFIRGQIPLNNIINKAGIRDLLKDPIAYWVKHSYWADRLFFVKFEDLKKDQSKIVDKISKKFKYKLKNNKIKTVDGLVGPYPRKGVVGDYTNYFTEDDLIFFNNKAGSRMVELGYV